MILEYEEVAKREASRLELQAWVVDSIIDMFCRIGSRQSIRFRLRPALNDPDDEFLLELAAAGQADFIVTHNVRDFRGAAGYRIQVATPGEFLRKIGVEL